MTFGPTLCGTFVYCDISVNALKICRYLFLTKFLLKFMHEIIKLWTAR